MGEQVAARIIWGCSSVGRAPALQAGGQEFESLHLHLIMSRAAEPYGKGRRYALVHISLDLQDGEWIFEEYP